MPHYFNKATILVVRDGRRLRVEPGPQPFDFTEDEIATAIAAGVRMEKFTPVSPQTIVTPEAPASKPAKAKAKAKAAADDDEDEDGI